MDYSTTPMRESDSWCRTTSGDKASTSFTWTIEDFFNRPESQKEFMYSSPFTVFGPNDKETTWRLKLYPREDEVTVYLENTGKTTKERVFHELSLINGRNLREDTRNFTPQNLVEGYGAIFIISRDELTLPHLLPNGNLTILCEITVFDPKVLSGSKFPDERFVPGDNYRKQMMMKQFGKLFGNKKFSDVKIICGEDVFHCHRNILSVRSPVFEAMFESEMRENRSQEVIIRDMKPDVVREMLHFIYNGATSTETVMDDTGNDLLAAADRYQLNCLLNKCEEKLCSSLEVSNSLELLFLADLHHASKLRNMALKLVANNIDLLVDTDVYKDFVKHHPDISVEITKLVAKRASAGIE